MSTRSTVCVYDDRDRFYIYRHCDGYPDGPHGVVADLSKALPFAWPLPRFQANDFAAAIICAWKDGGGNIYFTTGHDAHCDSEYQYDITHKDGGLWIEVQSVGGMWDDDDTEETRERETLFNGSLSAAIQHFTKVAA